MIAKQKKDLYDTKSRQKTPMVNFFFVHLHENNKPLRSNHIRGLLKPKSYLKKFTIIILSFRTLGF